MSNTILAAQVRTSMWLRRTAERVRSSELGQGAVEYAGIIVVVVALIGLVVGFAEGWAGEINTGITNKIKEIFGS